MIGVYPFSRSKVRYFLSLGSTAPTMPKSFDNCLTVMVLPSLANIPKAFRPFLIANACKPLLHIPANAALIYGICSRGLTLKPFFFLTSRFKALNKASTSTPPP